MSKDEWKKLCDLYRFFVNIQNAEHTDYTKTTFILHKFEETFPELMSIPTSFTRPGT